MAKTADTAKMADINDPAPDHPETRDRLPPEARTVAPTPQAVRPRTKQEGVADLARKATSEHAEAARESAAERAAKEAERVREAGESFDANSFAHAASERIADNLSEAARSIQTTDLNQVTDELATFARRQPLLFFGGAALLGFAAGRAIKASERAEHASHVAPSYGRGVS